MMHLSSSKHESLRDSSGLAAMTGHAGSPCWIGMNDIAVEGSYLWSDGSAVDFQHFSGHTEDPFDVDVDLGRYVDEEVRMCS